MREATFLSSPVVGAKAGVCPGLFPNVCGELEFDHFNPTLDSQNTQGQLTTLVTGQPPQTQNIGFTGKIDLSVWNVGLNLIGRLPFLMETGYPLGGRLHLYGGAGPAFVWTQARNQCNTSGGAPFCGGSDTDFSVGVQALGGLKFFITKNLAVFGEYKFKHWTSEFKFSGIGSVTSGGTTTTFDVTSKVKDLDFNTNLFYVGLALHF